MVLQYIMLDISLLCNAFI